MTIYSPPPLVERFQYQKCKQINCEITRKRVYLTPQGEQLPSVTTILSGTKDMTHLNEWRKRVGAENAAQITKEAASVGTALHKNLENFLLGKQRQPGNNPVHIKANAMANKIIEHGLSHMQEIWAIEQSLYYPGLYSGTTDLCGVYNGNPAICDFKQSNRLKKESYVDDYRIQLVAYIMAHNEVYGTDIKEGHIFMCSRGKHSIKIGGEEYQQFDLWPSEFNQYQDKWLAKVEEYYRSSILTG